MDKRQLFNGIYSENRERVWRLCCGFCSDRDDRRDLFQAILLKVWENLGTYRGQSKISTWLYRIAANTALMWIRREKRRRRLIDPLGIGTQETPSMPTIADEIERTERFRQLTAAMNRLEATDRLIIGMVLEDLPYREIAEVTGLTVNHIGVKVNRIRKKLQSMLKE